MVGRVGDRQVVAVGQPVADQVIEHAAVLAAQQAVLRAALGQPAHVGADQPLQQRLRIRAAGLDLAHVGDVEHPRGLPDGQMLLADARVLDRHLPAGERHQPGPGRDVAGVQGQTDEGCRRRPRSPFAG